ncbi:hypothetical protein C1645_211172 [Glomus cerebriforme]|uniref:Uncharacterized protein n=1 Tax=Glomus cerebriforme TaxID=658196 RepID=A0A397TI56_9GLOM|nr:hypothetical protein C1645_211172 [Glomus cerebriforme]
MSTKPINQDEVMPTLNFESPPHSIPSNDSRQNPELFFKHQNRNPFLKKRITQDQATEPSDASDFNNTKAPNVFASPHFRTRTNATRLPFKEFQKKEINNLNNLTSLFFKKSGNESKEITNDPFISNFPNFNKKSIVERDIVNQEILNQRKSLDNEKAVEYHKQNLPLIHDKSKRTSDQKVPDNSLSQSLELSAQPPTEDKLLIHSTSLNNNDLEIDHNKMIEDSTNIPKEDNVIEKSNLSNKSLPENYQNFLNNNNVNPSRDNSSSCVQQQMQRSYSKVNDQQPKLQIQDKINSSNPVYLSQVKTNLDNLDNVSFPTTEHNNSEIKDHSSSDNELNLIIEAVQRWKDEVVRRDYLIAELVRHDIFTFVRL